MSCKTLVTCRHRSIQAKIFHLAACHHRFMDMRTKHPATWRTCACTSSLALHKQILGQGLKQMLPRHSTCFWKASWILMSGSFMSSCLVHVPVCSTHRWTLTRTTNSNETKHRHQQANDSVLQHRRWWSQCRSHHRARSIFR